VTSAGPKPRAGARPSHTKEADRPPPASFARLLAPHSLDAFFARHWEKQVLHIVRGDPHYYDELLTLGEVERALSSGGGLRYPAVQLSRGGSFLPPEAFCEDIRAGEVVFAGVPNLVKLNAEYRAGATVSLPGFHRASRPLMQLVCELEDYLSHGVHTNIYLTPAHSSGFDPHYDTHEVFVLQISGTKHWRFFEPILEAPHQSQPFHPRMFEPSQPTLELDMAPGDLLYVPRGVLHTTTTSETASAHVTLGATVYTFVELLTVWVQGLKNDPAVRRGLPPGFAWRPELAQKLGQDFSALLAGLQQGLDVEVLTAGFLDRVRAGYPGQVKSPVDFAADRAVGPTSMLRAPDAGRYALQELGETLSLHFAGKTVSLPRAVGAALRAICAKPSFRPSELPQDLGPEATLTLVRHLYREGFLALLKP
jgi:hypothetical protein